MIKAYFNNLKRLGCTRCLVKVVPVSTAYAGLSLLSLLYPLLYGNFIRALELRQNFTGIIITLFVILLGSTVLESFFAWLYGRIYAEMDVAINSSILTNFKRIPEGRLSELGEGYYESLIDSVLYGFVSLLTPDSFVQIFSMVKFIFIGIFLFIQLPVSGLVFTAAFLIYVLNYLYKRKYYTERYRNVIRQTARTRAYMVESLSLTTLYSSFPLLFKESNARAEGMLENLNEKTRKLFLLSGTVYRFGSKFFLPLLTFLLYFILGRMYLNDSNGAMEISFIVMIISYFSQLSGIFTDFDSLSDSVIQGATSATELGDFLDISESSKKIPTHPDTRNFFLKMDNLSLKYDEKHILENISLQLELGNIYGLVGLTGQGKTSFISALLGDFEPAKGKIDFLKNGLSVYEFDVRRNLLYISQNTYLLNDTLESNLRMGNGDIPRDKLSQLLELLELEIPLERVLGTRGYKTSGGEKRKINIGRFLLHIPLFEYFILDELLVSLDSLSKNNIMGLLKEAIQGRTGIIISHDLNELQILANRFLVFESNNHIAQGEWNKIKESSPMLKKLLAASQFQRI